MKSFLIIGMGRFGQYLCRELSKLGNEILAVDVVEERLAPCLHLVTSAQIGDWNSGRKEKTAPQKPWRCLETEFCACRTCG